MSVVVFLAYMVALMCGGILIGIRIESSKWIKASTKDVRILCRGELYEVKTADDANASKIVSDVMMRRIEEVLTSRDM